MIQDKVCHYSDNGFETCAQVSPEVGTIIRNTIVGVTLFTLFLAIIGKR